MRRCTGDAATFTALAFACLLGTVAGGRDLNWDLAHYHLYVPFAWLSGRLGEDFFAAGLQSYLNPLPHLPLSAMQVAHWHALAMAAALTLPHAAAVGLVYLSARALLQACAGEGGRIETLLCTLLAAACIPFLSALGRSHTDVLTALPVLVAFWLVCSGALAHRAGAESALVGLLTGAAAGLKLTNALYVVAGAGWPLVLGARWRGLVAYGAAALCGALLTGGWWAWRLWQEFGNPFFPHFNGWFASPDFPSVDLGFERHRPQSAAAFLSAPFRMAVPGAMVYTEMNAPDARPALLVAAGAALAAVRLRRQRAESAPVPRAVKGAAAFVLPCFALWTATSFHARYGIALLLLLGPLLAASVALLVPARLLRAVLAALLAAQGLLLLAVAPSRPTPAEPHGWTREWLAVRVPERLAREPFLYLAIDRQSYSFVATRLHPDSRFVSVRGGHVVDLDGPGGARLARLMERFGERLRSIGYNALAPGALAPDPEWVRQRNLTLARLGVAIDGSDCVRLDPLETVDTLAALANRLVGTVMPRGPHIPMSCALRRTSVSEALKQRRREADAILDIAERACPRAFPPGLARTERVGDYWVRSYASTERDLAWNGAALFSTSHVDGKTHMVAEHAHDKGTVRSYQCPN